MAALEMDMFLNIDLASYQCLCHYTFSDLFS